jgi:sugar lactone lactonase YvrE
MKKIFLTILTITLFSCATPEKKLDTVYYPPLPQKPRIQFLVSITSDDDLGKKTSGLEEFLEGKQMALNKIERPFDISASKGRIYVSDTLYKKILIINLEKKEIEFLKDEGAGSLVDPMGIWVTEDDIKYVTDKGRKQIIVFDRDNKYLKAYGEKEQFALPLDTAVYKDRIYVCDRDKNSIEVIDKDTGKTIQSIGGIGSEEGKLYKPTHVIVDHEGNIYVNDNFNFRVQKFSPDGAYIKHFGYQGDTLGAFARTKGIAVDNEGHFYAADVGFEKVQVFDDKTAEFVAFFGEYGEKPGDMYMPSPVYIDFFNTGYFEKYVDNNFKVKYLIYVGNMAGLKKLNVYGYGDWIGEPLPGIEIDQKK